MTDYEYALADEEVFAMVNGRTTTGGKTVGVVVPVSRVQELAKLEQIQAMMPVVSTTLVAAIFLAAASLGWTNMTFGIIAALIVATRAITLYWRYWHGRK